MSERPAHGVADSVGPLSFAAHSAWPRVDCACRGGADRGGDPKLTTVTTSILSSLSRYDTFLRCRQTGVACKTYLFLLNKHALESDAQKLAQTPSLTMDLKYFRAHETAASRAQARAAPCPLDYVIQSTLAEEAAEAALREQAAMSKAKEKAAKSERKSPRDRSRKGATHHTGSAAFAADEKPRRRIRRHVPLKGHHIEDGEPAPVPRTIPKERPVVGLQPQADLVGDVRTMRFEASAKLFSGRPHDREHHRFPHELSATSLRLAMGAEARTETLNNELRAAREAKYDADLKAMQEMETTIADAKSPHNGGKLRLGRLRTQTWQHSGFLSRRGQILSWKWTQFFYVLCDGVLYEFSDGLLTGTLNEAWPTFGATVHKTRPSSREHPYTLKAEVSPYFSDEPALATFELSAQTVHERDEWEHALSVQVSGPRVATAPGPFARAPSPALPARPELGARQGSNRPPSDAPSALFRPSNAGRARQRALPPHGGPSDACARGRLPRPRGGEAVCPHTRRARVGADEPREARQKAGPPAARKGAERCQRAHGARAARDARGASASVAAGAAGGEGGGGGAKSASEELAGEGGSARGRPGA